MARRSNLPKGFIEPCAPVLVPKPPVGTEWLHEIKQNGYRIIARRDGDRVYLWSRTGIDYAGGMTSIAATLRQLPCQSCLIDGEAVVFRPDGSCDFYALPGRRGQAVAILSALDLLALNGADLRGLPLEERRAQLQKLLRKPPTGIQFSEAFRADGEVVFRHACALGAEAIVSKRVGSPYRSGRSDAWRKTRCPDYRRS